MGKKMRFRGIKHSPKRLEGDILERSKNLWETPGLLRPKCAGDCRRCHFDKTFARISRLEKIKDDPDSLVKMAGKGGDDIFKAYAAAISLFAAGSIPYLATAKLAGEEVSFAQRGRVGNDKLIGAQYYNDPRIRLLLYNSFAKKKKLHIYSFDDELVCSNHPNMPDDYLLDTFWDTPYEFENDGLQCGHTSDGILVLRIKSLDKEIRICKDCAKDVSTLQFIISRLIATDPKDDFEVSVEHKYHSEGEESIVKISKDLLEDYASGKLTDVGILNSVLKDKIGSLQQSDVATYIIGTKNYGSDLETFMNNLRGNDIEKEALSVYLTGKPDSVIIRTDKASEALTVLWNKNYRNIIASLTTDEIADSFGNVSKMNPSQTVREAHLRYISSEVISKLPDFGKMGVVTRYADDYAKAAKVGGVDMLKAKIDKLMPKDHITRSLARAFMLAVSGDAGGKYSKDEVEFGEFLLPFVKEVLDAEGEAYRDKMNVLLTACGCGERV